MGEGGHRIPLPPRALSLGFLMGRGVSWRKGAGAIRDYALTHASAFARAPWGSPISFPLFFRVPLETNCRNQTPLYLQVGKGWGSLSPSNLGVTGYVLLSQYG
jgi:hypothetical protein